MKIQLALVLTCNENGCLVETLPEKGTLKAVYSSLVQDRVMIQPEQLVALDLEPDPPEIIWRWLRGLVIELGEEAIVVDDMQGHPASVTLVPELPLTLALDDEVWICGTGRDFEVHDLILDGRPTHPEQVLKYITPIIEEIYRG